jgi:hypothetical protein
MAGGMQGRPSPPLSARSAPPPVEQPEEPTACWVFGSEEFPASVLAWRRHDDTWVALITAWVPAERVRRRSAQSQGQ